MSALSSSSSTLTPYTRSRTSLFLSYRDSAIRPSPASPYPLYEDEHEAVESKGLLSEMEEGRRGSVMSLAGASRGRASAALPPKWVDLADRVQEVLDRLKPKSECGVLDSAAEPNGARPTPSLTADLRRAL